MPHFVSKNMFMQTNSKHHDFHIMEYLINMRFPNLRILPVVHNNNIIFIRCIQRKQDFLYKIDKLTRYIHLLKLKEILLHLSKSVEVLHHNLHQTHAKHIGGVQKGFLIKEDRLHTIQPCFIEIGFGSGRHILELAKNNPNKIILGFEIHAPSIRQVLHAIETYHLDNLYICNLDARLGIQIFNPNSVEAIFLHFPVPWNKQKHRRVWNRDFLENSFMILKDSGYIDIRSDDLEYIQDCMNEALSANFAHFEVMKNQSTKVVSKYEQRWSNLQKDIYDLRIFKQNIHEIQSFEDLTHFDFPLEIHDISHFCNKKWVDKTIFINIGDLYQSEKYPSYMCRLQSIFAANIPL